MHKHLGLQRLMSINLRTWRRDYSNNNVLRVCERKLLPRIFCLYLSYTSPIPHIFFFDRYVLIWSDLPNSIYSPNLARYIFCFIRFYIKTNEYGCQFFFIFTYISVVNYLISIGTHSNQSNGWMN